MWQKHWLWEKHNKALSIILMNTWRKSWKKGINWVDVSLETGFVGDHRPKFYFNFTLLNTKLIEIHFYDTRHLDNR